MNKKAKTFLAYIILSSIFILSILGFINAATGYAISNQGLSLNYNLVTEDIAGRHYTPQCLGTCDLVFSLSYSGNSAPESASIDNNKLTTQFNWLKGQDKLKGTETYYLNEYQEEVNDYSNLCLPYTETDQINGTTTEYQNCTQIISGSHPETRQEWKELKGLTLEKGKTYYIDIRGFLNPSLEGFSVDVIPNINIAQDSFELNEMAWWNSTWKLSRNISINSTIPGLTYYQVRLAMNITDGLNAGNISSNCGDIRFVNSTGQEIPYYIEICQKGKNSIFWVKVPQINDTISMYYNSTYTTTTSSLNNTFEIYWTSDDNVGWTVGGACAISNDLINKRLNFTSCSRYNDIGWSYKTNTSATVNYTFDYVVRSDNTASGEMAVIGFNDGIDKVSGITPKESYGIHSGFWDAATDTYYTSWDSSGISAGTTIAGDTTYFARMTRAGTVINTTYYSDKERTTSVLSEVAAYTSATRSFTIFNFVLAFVADNNGGLTTGWMSNLTLGKYSGGDVNYSIGVEESIPSGGGTVASESQGDSAILSGIGNSTINASYTAYPSQQIYMRNVTTQQQLGRFDYVAVSGNQRWAFNYVTTGDSTSGFTYMVNMTTALYVWEAANLTASQITEQVKAFINSTNQSI